MLNQYKNSLNATIFENALINPPSNKTKDEFLETTPGAAEIEIHGELHRNISIDHVNIHLVNKIVANPRILSVENHGCLKVVHVQPQPELSLKTKISKRIFDIAFSLVIMILGFPVFAIVYLITKLSSEGPPFFKQERVGKDERRFHIYKFRSMYINAEKFGPQLSSKADPRITRWGRVIRRTRLDELPQFWNVLKGDMSVVGPRPERQFYIEKIIEKNPDYKKLQRLKPGVTSLGQVHFGYAENVEQMCIRMMYDLHYLQKPNISSDLKIIAKTIKVMVQCKGK